MKFTDNNVKPHFSEKGEGLNTESFYRKFDNAGEYEIVNAIAGYKTWWYPDIYYVTLSDSEYRYDPSYLYH